MPSNTPFINFNNLPGSNNLPIANNLAAPNTLSILNSLPAESNFPANRLQLQNKLPFSNGIANEGLNNNNALFSNNVQTTNGFPVNNFLANSFPPVNKFPVNNYLTNDLPGGNNFPINNFFANGLQAGNNFPSNNYLANSLPAVNSFPVNNFLASGLPAFNNFPTNNYLGSGLPAINSLPDAILAPINPVTNVNNLANNVLTLNKGILSPGLMTSNVQPNINSITNAPVFNNLANISPKVLNNLAPEGLVAKSNLPAVNNLMSKMLNDLIENNARTTARETNNLIPKNNMQILNELPYNNNLCFGPQIHFPLNVPAPMPLCEDNSVTNVPKNNILYRNTANNNNFPENSLFTDNLLLSINKCGNFPNINSLQNQNIVLNNAQSFLTTLPAANMANGNIDNIQHLQSNVQNCNQPKFLSNLPIGSLLANGDLTPTNFITNSMPCTNKNLPNINLLNNLPKFNLPEFNSLSCNLPISNNIASSLPFVNNLNAPNNKLFGLGELTSLPIMNGLPVIGVTETVTVINTTPSLYL